jgi:hypothetical protein
LSHLWKIRASRAAYVVIPILAVAACADSTGLLTRKPVSVVFMASPTTRALPSLAATSPSLALAPVGPSAALAPAGATVSVTSVELVVSHLELEQAKSSCAAPTHAEAECEEVQLKPMLVSLAVGGSAQTAVTAQIPVGTYTEFQAGIQAVRQADSYAGAQEFLTAHPDLVGYSVRVKGTYTPSGGAPVAFTYLSQAKAELELDLAPPLVVSAASTTINLAVDVDVSGWFKSGTSLINPSSQLSVAERTTIDANIRKSLRAFEDKR